MFSRSCKYYQGVLELLQRNQEHVSELVLPRACLAKSFWITRHRKFVIENPLHLSYLHAQAKTNKYKFKKKCPLSVKGAPVIDYKNIRLLKKYVSENGKILPSRITNISQKKQRELSLSIKRARNLALI